jgi:uncharacterized protein YkwD
MRRSLVATHQTAVAAQKTAPRRTLAFVAAAGIVATGLVATGGTPAHAATSSNNASYFVNAINAKRAAHGRPKLVVSSEMTGAAQRWAAQMAKKNDLYHNPRLASSVSNWRYLGENVGVGYSVSSLENAFYASPEHRDNMLDKDYTQIGVAVVVVDGKMWVAEEYRRPMHSTKATLAKASKPAAKVYHLGSRGAGVRHIQRLLHIHADGVFGPHTRTAVKHFQKKHHLKVTGKVNVSTLKALKH